MNMSGDIRVKTEKRYRTLFNEFRNFVVGDMHELFFISACVGFRNGKKKALSRGADPRFWSSTITPEEYSCYYAMRLETNKMDLSAIEDDRRVIAEIEEYSNAGMEVLIHELLCDYLVGNEDEYRIDVSLSNRLPRALLQYLYELV